MPGGPKTKTSRGGERRNGRQDRLSLVDDGSIVAVGAAELTSLCN